MSTEQKDIEVQKLICEFLRHQVESLKILKFVECEIFSERLPFADLHQIAELDICYIV